MLDRVRFRPTLIALALTAGLLPKTPLCAQVMRAPTNRGVAARVVTTPPGGSPWSRVRGNGPNAPPPATTSETSQAAIEQHSTLQRGSPWTRREAGASSNSAAAISPVQRNVPAGSHRPPSTVAATHGAGATSNENQANSGDWSAYRLETAGGRWVQSAANAVLHPEVDQQTLQGSPWSGRSKELVARNGAPPVARETAVASSADVGAPLQLEDAQGVGPGSIVVGLPRPEFGTDGNLRVQPNVRTVGRSNSQAVEAADVTPVVPMHAPEPPTVAPPTLGLAPGLRQIDPRNMKQGLRPVQAGFAKWLQGDAGTAAPAEVLPGPGGGGAPIDSGQYENGVAAPVFGELIEQHAAECCPHCGTKGGSTLFGNPCRCGRMGPLFPGCRKFRDAGIGRERVGNAVFEISATQPMKNFQIRMDSAYNVENPDRAEYFWAKIGGPKGPPLPESTVDYQDLRFQMEVGGPKFTTTTELPIRSLDPTFNNNTTSFADMSVATKLLLYDGESFQIAQWNKIYTPTGVFRRGTGTGHVSIEPGFLFRYKYSELTYLHGEIKFWIPIAADLDHGGEVLKMGAGLSHVAHETDSFAIIPTFELVGWSILDGLETPFLLPGVLLPGVEVDPESILNIQPGARFVMDGGGGIGLFEFGVSGAFAVTENHWHDGLLRFDLRWSF